MTRPENDSNCFKRSCSEMYKATIGVLVMYVNGLVIPISAHSTPMTFICDKDPIKMPQFTPKLPRKICCETPNF